MYLLSEHTHLIDCHHLRVGVSVSVLAAVAVALVAVVVVIIDNDGDQVEERNNQSKDAEWRQSRLVVPA